MEYLTYHFRELLDMHPDDSFGMNIEGSLKLEYSKNEKTTINVVKVTGYYWDDDDHRKLDFWLWEENKTKWTCKLMDLTVESRKKLYEYIKSHIN